MKSKHNVLATFSYDKPKVDKGYANQTLYVNIESNEIKSKPVTQDMKDKFIGGRGFDLWLLWHAVNDDTRWDSPENEICIATGPIGGTTQYPGTGKSLVTTISPTTEQVIDSNVGGYFGPLLKFSGWDALEIQGKATEEIIIVIDGEESTVTIETAPEEPVDTHILSEILTDMYAEDEDDRRNVSVVSAGRGAEHALIGCLNFSLWDVRRGGIRVKQAGRGGIGSVFRNKKLKALVVRQPGVSGDSNNPADLNVIQKTGVKMHREICTEDHRQERMRTTGTPHLIEVMNAYDLLPVHNFQYGKHDDTPKITSDVWFKLFTQGIPDGCWYGCSMACAKTVENFELRTGPYKGEIVRVDGPEYETAAGVGSNCGIFDPAAILELNFYCDTYGVDTISWGTTVAFLMECYERGIINKEHTGGLELKFGNREASLELLHQVARGEGFGLIAGQGIRRIKKIFADKFGADINFLNDIGMENKGLEYSQYVSKESLAQQGGYALTNKGPQHDEAWLIFMDMVNNQIPTFEDKAEALHYFPLWRTWFGLNGLCKLPWNDVTPADNPETDEPNKVPEHVDNYVKLFNGVTGMNITREEIILQSKRVYDFQRVFNIRLGKGLRKFDAQPYRAAGPVTKEEYESRAERYDGQLKELVGFDPEGKSTEEKLAALRVYKEDQYEKLMDSVYKRRGWTENAVPKIETLKEIGIDYPEIVEVVKRHL
ncbi:MAG: aldehyde:ferredoxin oxidoreductase [Planctomycetota bacterium]|nr:MAG: aldehyde:ferredoxin oxidoreductase [Planctomycetota bacterium]